MSYQFKRLIWDFDGTLYDTYNQLTNAMIGALGDYYRFAKPEEVYALLKHSVYHACCELSKRFGVPVERLMAAFQKHHAREENFPLSEGAFDCLCQTSRRGCRHYLYTHRDRGAIEQLHRDDLNMLFDDYVTREDPFPDKPSPAALQFLMEKHHFEPEDAYMIGDRDIDIGAGRAAGMHTILYDPFGFFPDLATDYRFETMAQIRDLMLKLNA